MPKAKPKTPVTELGKILGFDPPDYAPEAVQEVKPKVKRKAKPKAKRILVYPPIPCLPAKILAFDPGFGLCGFAVLKVGEFKIELDECGVIKTTPDSTYAQRLATIWRDLNDLFETHQPNLIVAEKFFSNNLGNNAVNVSQARGLIVTLSGLHNLPLYEPKPNEVKKYVHGSGSATKKEMQIAVSEVLGLSYLIEPDDAADAVANGLLGAWGLQRNTLALSMGEDEFNQMGSYISHFDVGF